MTRPVPARSRSTALAVALCALAATACVPPGDPSIPGEQDSALTGYGRFDSSCSGAVAGMISTGQHWGRIVGNSSAFGQCVRRAIVDQLPVGVTDEFGRSYGAGPYYGCIQDPGNTATQPPTADQRIAIYNAVILAMAHTRDIGNSCAVPDPRHPYNAQAGGLGPAPDFVEQLTWNQPWTTAMQASLANPVCGTPEAPGCRHAAAPWPAPHMAGMTWHEVLHDYGYQHGTNGPSPGARIACGIAASVPANWDFQVNTIPYLVENCMMGVAYQSVAVCGDPTAGGCGFEGLRLIDGIDSNRCTCVGDPDWSTLPPLPGGAVIGVPVLSSNLTAATDQQSNIYRLAGGAWTRIGNAGRSFAANDVGLFGATYDGMQIWRYNGTPMSWTLIGSAGGGVPVQRLLADGNLLFYVNTNNEPYRYDGGTTWTKVGGAGSSFALNRNYLYGASGDGLNILRLAGGNWSVVGSGASIGGGSRQLLAGGGNLFSLSLAAGNVYRGVDGGGGAASWSLVGGPGSSFAVNDTTLYGLAGANVMRYSPASQLGGVWEQVAGSAVRVIAGGNQLALLRDDLHTWRLLSVP